MQLYSLVLRVTEKVALFRLDRKKNTTNILTTLSLSAQRSDGIGYIMLKDGSVMIAMFSLPNQKASYING